MSVRIATHGLVAQRVTSVLARRPEAKIIVLRAEPEWANGDFVLDGRRVSVAPCVSSLAVRSSLAEWTNRRAEGVNDVLVVLCDLADSDLGADVLARFTPPRILGLDPWSAVEQLFEQGDQLGGALLDELDELLALLALVARARGRR